MGIACKTIAPYRTCMTEDLLACFSLVKGNCHKYVGANHILYSGWRPWMPYWCLLVYLLLAVLARVTPPPPFLCLILLLVPLLNALQCPPLASITVGRNIWGPVLNKASSVCPAVSVAGTMQWALLDVRDVGHGRRGSERRKCRLWGGPQIYSLDVHVPFLRRGWRDSFVSPFIFFISILYSVPT